jgi:hypothetical protein
MSGRPGPHDDSASAAVPGAPGIDQRQVLAAVAEALDRWPDLRDPTTHLDGPVLRWLAITGEQGGCYRIAVEEIGSGVRLAAGSLVTADQATLILRALAAQATAAADAFDQASPPRTPAPEHAQDRSLMEEAGHTSAQPISEVLRAASQALCDRLTPRHVSTAKVADLTTAVRLEGTTLDGRFWCYRRRAGTASLGISTTLDEALRDDRYTIPGPDSLDVEGDYDVLTRLLAMHEAEQ